MGVPDPGGADFDYRAGSSKMFRTSVVVEGSHTSSEFGQKPASHLRQQIVPPGDFRPYLHIHDHDFSLLVNANKPQAGVVVGVTVSQLSMIFGAKSDRQNPFFRNAASHWPNVITIPSERPRRTPAGAITTKHVLDGPEGFITQRHRSISKDRPLLKRLEAVVAAGDLDSRSTKAFSACLQLTLRYRSQRSSPNALSTAYGKVSRAAQ